MRRWLWPAVLLLVLIPAGIVSIGTQVALGLGAAGVIEAYRGYSADSAAGLQRGARMVSGAGATLQAAWSNPASYLLEFNPLTLGTVDELRPLAAIAGQAAAAAEPAARLGVAALGFGGTPPLAVGSTIELDQLPGLQEPSKRLSETLTGLVASIASLPTSGLVGSRVGPPIQDALPRVTRAADLAGAAASAMPALPEALGSSGTKRYLVCVLNDAELFGSGGAPLSALVLEATDGTISVGVSGSTGTDLTPGNPSIRWDYAGGPPWYRTGLKYPFVNADFHPDFPTAATDLARAWHASGYEHVDGVVTVDVAALAAVLAVAGPVTTEGYGEVTSDNVRTKVLVDAYRDYNTTEGIRVRHGLNEQLKEALIAHLSTSGAGPEILQAVLDAMPPRHVQMAFDNPELEQVARRLTASGELPPVDGDVVGVFSQSAPNKLSIFQARSIEHTVTLNSAGGAAVSERIEFTNAVPDSLTGDPGSWSGYLALRARMRVAYRVPLGATDLSVRVKESKDAGGGMPPTSEAVDSDLGPYPDGQGGQVLWQGHETAPGASTTVLVTYELPPGTFAPGTYHLVATPQALTIPAALTVRVVGDARMPSPDTGWQLRDGSLVWSGSLDRPLDLELR